MSHTTQSHVVLVGGGHAHLQVIAAAAALQARGARVSVIAPRTFWYSGLATAVLGGSHQPADDQIDIADLAARHGVAWVDERVIAVDAAGHRLQLGDGRWLDFDLVSFNVGSEVALPAGLAPAPDCWPVKPISNMAALREWLEAGPGRERKRVVVAGGGPTGCEVTANLAALAERVGLDLELALVHQGARLLPSAPAGAGRRLERNLQRRGVAVHHGNGLTADADGRPGVAGSALAADSWVFATGLKAAPLAQTLAADDSDGIPVTGALHHPAHPDLFAAGDCAHFLPRSLPKVGVFGVRQGPVLIDNLLARLEDRPLRTFRPQARYLTILNLGDGTGLALRGSLWWHGRLALRLKHRLDRGFLQNHRCGRSI